MKILLVDHVGKKHEGHALYTKNLGRALSELTVDVKIYSDFEHPLSDSNYYFRNRSVIEFIRSIVSLKFRLPKSESTLIVHGFEYNLKIFVFILMLKFLNKNLHLIVHDVKSLRSDAAPFLGPILGLASSISVHNEHSKNELSVNTKKDIKIIRHGSYLNDIGVARSKDESRRRLGLKDNAFYALCFGQMRESKGLSVALQAMHLDEEKSFNLLIAGTGSSSMVRKIEDEIKSFELEKRITWDNRFIESDLVFDYYNACDVCLLPYTNIYQSGVAIMAMSYGAPVIASNLDAFSELIVDGKTGYLFEASCPHGLLAAIQKAVRLEPKELRKIANNGRNLIEREYNWREIASKYVELLCLKR